MNNNTPTPPPITLADLERLAGSLALMPDDDSDDEISINATDQQRKQYKFWLRFDKGGELALMPYLDAANNSRKMKALIILALRYAILSVSYHESKIKGVEPVTPRSYVDDAYFDFMETLSKVDWTKY